MIQSDSEVAARRLAEHVIRKSYLVDPVKHAEMEAFARQHEVACPPRMTEEQIAEFVESSWRDFVYMGTA